MHKVLIHCCLLALLQFVGVNCARCVEPTTATVTTVEGPEAVGEIIEWTTDSISLRQSTQESAFSAKEILRLDFQSTQKPTTFTSIAVELIDGSRFPVTKYEVSDRKATIETTMSAGSISIPTEQIRCVEFPSNGKVIAGLSKTLQNKDPTGDVLVLVKKDSTELDFLSGVINDITATEINFAWEGETIPVKRSKVAAISYYHSRPPELADPLCWLNLAQGYRLPVAKIVREADELQVTTTTGILLRVRINEIQTADYSIGKLAYLSDLEPLLEEWTPLIQLPTTDNRVKQLGMPRRDASFEGSPLTLSWPVENDSEGSILKAYPKGLALRSRTVLEYRVPRGMRRFKAQTGIDPETSTQGNVLLTVSTDGVILMENEIDGSQPPVAIDMDISGKRQLKIIVDYGSNLDLGDRLHLVEARFVK